MHYSFTLTIRIVREFGFSLDMIDMAVFNSSPYAYMIVCLPFTCLPFTWLLVNCSSGAYRCKVYPAHGFYSTVLQERAGMKSTRHMDFILLFFRSVQVWNPPSTWILFYSSSGACRYEIHPAHGFYSSVLQEHVGINLVVQGFCSTVYMCSPATTYLQQFVVILIDLWWIFMCFCPQLSEWFFFVCVYAKKKRVC